MVSATTEAFYQEEVNIGIEHVFVPKGFDSNDSNVEVVIAGNLPDTCHRLPRGVSNVTGNRVDIEMKATKVSGADTVCIMAVVPYMVSVSLGTLNEGQYDIVVVGENSQQKNSYIYIDRPNSASINNYSYAYVRSVKKGQYGQHGQEWIIEGEHPSSCMKLDRVEIYVNDAQDTYSVLPIIKAVEPICDRLMTPFSYSVYIPESLPNRRMRLMHVRKIDGTALNYLIKR